MKKEKLATLKVTRRDGKPVEVPTAAIPTTKELQAYTRDLPEVKKITSQGGYETAMERYKLIGTASKNLKAKKDSVLNPLKLAIKNLNAIFKPFEDKIAQAEEDYKTVLNAYVQEKAAARVEQVSKIENDKRLSNPVTIQEKLNAVGEQESGTFKVKVVKVIDESKIPLRFFDRNDSRILAAFKSGEAVPGVEVVDEVRVRR